MNGTPINQQPQPEPQPQPQELAPRRSPWMAVGIVLIVVGIAAIAYLMMGGTSRTPAPPPPAGGTPPPADQSSGQLDQEILQEIGQVSAGRTAADVDQDIQATNLEAINQELEALEQEMRGL